MLPKQLVPLVVGQGINTKIDPKLLTMQANLELDNIRITKQGRVEKRYGYEALASLSNVSRAFSFGGTQLLATTDEGLRLHKYIPALSAWQFVGYTSPFQNDLVNLTNDDEGQSAVAWAINGSFLCVTYNRFRGTVDQGVYYRLFDATDLTLIQSGLISASATRSKVVKGVSNDFYIAYNEGSNLRCVKLSTVTLALETPQTVSAALKAASPFFDLKWHPILLKPVIAWNNSAPNVSIGYLTVSGSLETSPASVSVADDADGAIHVSVNESSGIISLAWCNATPRLSFVQYTYQSLTAVAAVGTQTISQLARNLTYNGSVLLVENTAPLVNNQPINFFVTIFTPNATASWPLQATIRGVGIVSEVNGDFCVIGAESVLQPIYLILHIPSATIVGKIAALSAGGLSGAIGTVGTAGYTLTGRGSSLTPFDGSRLVIGVKNGLESVSGQIFGFRNVAFCSLQRNPPIVPAESESLFIPGSVVTSYDGVQVSEAGFYLSPENVSVSAPFAGTGGAGTYGYAVTYSFEDAQGLFWESAPFFGSFTLTNNHQVTLTIPTLRVTSKPATVQIQVYRTVANGTVYYKQTDSASPLYNDPQVDTVTYNVNPPATDTAILSNPLIYTTGGVLENDQAPSCGSITVYRNRFVYAGLEKKQEIAYSKTVSATEPPNWNAAYTISVQAGGEQVTATATLDEKLIIFKPSALSVIAGDGPFDTGLSSDFQSPVAIATDVGSANPLSVVLFPNGLLFQSAKGLYLLDRGMNVSYKGAPVEAYNGLAVTGAVLLDDVNEVRFSTTSTTLCYNYFFDQWATHSNIGSVASSVLLNRFYIVKTNGQVWRETSGYSDAGSYITSTITTGWLAGQLQGFQRIYRFLLLGSLEAKAEMTVAVGYDYRADYSETFAFTTQDVCPLATYGETSPYGAGLFGGDFDGVFQIQILPSRQKCQSLRLKITDQSDRGVLGAGFTLSGITALIGAKTGANRMPVTRRIQGSGRV